MLGLRLLKRVCGTGALIALFGLSLVAGSASASNDPVFGDVTPAVSALLPPLAPVYHLRIRAVLTANDDGSHAATITGPEIQTQVNTANQVWSGSGFVFDFDPANDIEKRNDTLLNNDCSVVWEFSGTFPRATCNAQPNVEERERVALDPQHDGRITVYFRYGNSGLVCPSLLSCTNKLATGAYSSTAGHFVAFVDYNSGSTGLAHELGHYLWNAHTFGPQPTTSAEAAQDIDNYVEGKGGYTPHPASQGASVFDGDAARVTDTPPDPGLSLWTALKSDPCGTDPGDDSAAITVNLPSGARNYVLQPDRTNIMSYFKGCAAFAHTTSPQQRERALYAIEHGNRNQLICGCAAHFAELDSASSTSYPMGNAIIVPFLLAGHPHVLVYRKTDWKLDILRIGDDAASLTNLSSGWLTHDSGLVPSMSWTAFVPFILGGQPYFLAYDADSGETQTIRITSSGGVETVWSSESALSDGATALMPFVYAGQPYVIAYTGSTGHVEIARIAQDAAGLTTIWTGTWAAGSTALVPFVLNGQPAVMLYNTATGAALIGKVNVFALGVVWTSTSILPTGLDSFAPFDRGPQQRFLALDANTGNWIADRLDPAGAGVAKLDATWKPTLLSGATAVVVFREPGLWYALTYSGPLASTWSILQ